MLLLSGLSWNPVPAADLTIKHRLPVLLSSRVAANQSFLYKNANYCCPPCFSSASHGYVNLYNSYPASPFDRSALKKTFLSSNYRLNRYPPLPLSSRVVLNISILYKYVPRYCYVHCHVIKIIRNKIAPYYCTMCYCYASHGYVHLYYSYPDPPVNWTSVYDPASHCHVNKLIRNKIALCYCTTCYRSAFHGYVHLYNSYPDPPVNWTIFFNLAVTSAHSTSLVTLGSYNLVNKSTCYSSTSHVYLYLYKSYLDPPLNRSIFFNLSATTAYCTYVYSRLRVLSADLTFFCYAEPVLLNRSLPNFKEPVWRSVLNFSFYISPRFRSLFGPTAGFVMRSQFY